MIRRERGFLMEIRGGSVHGIRAGLLAVIRVVAVVLLAWGGFRVVSRVLFAVLGNGDIRTAWTVWTGAGESQGVFQGVPMVMVGIALAVLGRRIVVWVVRPPEWGCASCGYAVAANDVVCPECGRRVGGGKSRGGG